MDIVVGLAQAFCAFLIMLPVLFAFVFLSAMLCDIKEDISRNRYCSLREKIAAPKNKKRPFRRVCWFKQLLKSRHCVSKITEDITNAKIHQVLISYHKCKELNEWEKEAEEVWKLTEHQQLFTPKELKIIDAVNAKICAAVAKTTTDCEQEKAEAAALKAAAEARRAAMEARKAAEQKAKAKRTASTAQAQKAPPHTHKCRKAKKIQLPGVYSRNRLLTTERNYHV